MTITKKHIAIAFMISAFIGIVLLGIYLYRRRSPKSVADIQTLVSKMTDTNTVVAGLGGAPEIYGNQRVVKNELGIWQIESGTCTIVTAGIIDWNAIQNMTQIEKNKLFEDIEDCRTENLPLIQPNHG